MNGLFELNEVVKGAQGLNAVDAVVNKRSKCGVESYYIVSHRMTRKGKIRDLICCQSLESGSIKSSMSIGEGSPVKASSTPSPAKVSAVPGVNGSTSGSYCNL